MQPLSVAVAQTSAGRDMEQNLARVEALLAPLRDVDLIALPEVFALRGSDEDYRRHAEPLTGPTLQRLAGWARHRRAWLLAGSLIERDGDALFNTSVLLDRDGRTAARYRKIHLFEAYLDNGQTVREQDTYTAGREPALADVEGWRCGLAVCYDVRFPELFRHYAARGAHLFFLPANFTQRTGKDHWEVLVRCRAIENQCFVVAPGQCGANAASGIPSYGHSMIAGPWGDVLAEAGAEEQVLTAVLDPAELDRIRARIPVLRHRRLG